MHSVEDYLIRSDATCVAAFQQLDVTKKGFLIVVEEKKAVGTLTDGDLRRGLIAGLTISDEVQLFMCRDFTYLTENQGTNDAVDLFKTGSYNFLPVLDSNSEVKNLLTKKQLYTLLLQCKDFSLKNDFANIDETLMDFEIFNRPWGLYKTTVLQENYQSKILQVKPESSLSLQYHHRREEYWIVAYGEGIVQLGESRIEVRTGSTIFIPKGCQHRLTNTSHKDYLVVCEIQVGDYFGEDDIVRIEDDYGRAGGKAE